MSGSEAHKRLTAGPRAIASSGGEDGFNQALQDQSWDPLGAIGTFVQRAIRSQLEEGEAAEAYHTCVVMFSPAVIMARPSGICVALMISPRDSELGNYSNLI